MSEFNFDNTINIWIKALEPYPFADICVQPSFQGWSLGQLYLHLINDTQYYIEQVRTCLSSNENALEPISAKTAILFFQNSFPDERITGHPNNAFIPQPGSKAQLTSALLELKATLNAVKALIAESPVQGKTMHPGFGYLSAAEWYWLADMHFRHHLRQKQRIDDFLNQKAKD